RRTIALIAGPGWLTVNAANLWYLATGGAGNWSAGAPLLLPDSTPLLAGLTPRLIGVGLLALWTGAALIRWWLRGDAAFTAVLLVLGVFFLPPQAHERYAFGAVVFALISMRPALALAITVLHTLNLLWAFGLPPGMPLPAAFLLLMISVWIPRGASARLLPRAGRSRPATAQSPTGPQSTRR
ncbi:MAG: hypothetical protein GYB64_14990, partial [Chloroflexi bacterium]|nr:hypothetical protein [Chloroflexota bacterium]